LIGTLQPDPEQRDSMPRGPLLAIGALLLAVLLGVAAVRLSGTEIRTPDAPPVAQRSLRFEDRPDGSVAVIDARSGQQVDAVHGEAGFLRGALRAMARERRKQGLGAEPAFELVARADGRLTLLDPSTGERVDLESFGPTNAATFARLLTVQPGGAAKTPGDKP
jgi:putative photosynthetic complex assembly protein